MTGSGKRRPRVSRLFWMAPVVGSGATLAMAGLAAAQIVTPLPPAIEVAPKPSAPSPPPTILPAGKNLPYALVVTAPATADPRRPIPLSIRLFNRDGKPAPASSGLVVNLTVTTLKDLHQAKDLWVKEEIEWIQERDRVKISTEGLQPPPRTISTRADIVAWKLPTPLSEELLQRKSGPPQPIALDFFRTTAFTIFAFPPGKDAVTVNLSTSHLRSTLTVAAQAAGLLPSIRTVTTAPAQRASVPDLPSAAWAYDVNQNATQRVMTLDIRRQDYRLAAGWWSYLATASISAGPPPGDCYVDLIVGSPLRFDDPQTNEPRWEAVRLRLFPSADPTAAVTATVALETTEPVRPDSRPRRTRIHASPHCVGFTLPRTDVDVEIPPRPHKLFAEPDSLSTFARTGKIQVRFHVRDEGDVEVIPAMAGQETDGVWQVAVTVQPPSAGAVDPATVSLKRESSIAATAIQWTGPSRAVVSGTLTTTSSGELIRAAISLNLMFPFGPLFLATAVAPVTQLPPATRLLPLGAWMSVLAGIAWGALAFWIWYGLGPVVQEVTLGPVKMGFASGEVSGSFWVAAAVIGLLPLVFKLAVLVWRAARTVLSQASGGH